MKRVYGFFIEVGNTNSRTRPRYYDHIFKTGMPIDQSNTFTVSELLIKLHEQQPTVIEYIKMDAALYIPLVSTGDFPEETVIL